MLPASDDRYRDFFALLDGVPVPDDAEFLYDVTDPAGALRRRNLERYFELARIGDGRAGARTMLVGEAPGWRGMTVTGIPFLSFRELTARPGPITGGADGDGLEVPDDPQAPWEASSRDVWRTMARRRGPLPVFWPIYPHHPHVPGERRTNRSPRPAEVRAGAPLVSALQAAFDGIGLIAVGRKAQYALESEGIEAPAVRHPAQGGAALFAEQLLALGV